MIAALRRCAELADKPLTSADYHRLHQPTEPGASTIGQRFGNWARALAAADLPPTAFRHHRRWKHADALDAVARWADSAEDKRLPAYAAASAADPDLPLPDQLARMFGGWRRVLAALEQRSADVT